MALKKRMVWFKEATRESHDCKKVRMNEIVQGVCKLYSVMKYKETTQETEVAL